VYLKEVRRDREVSEEFWSHCGVPRPTLFLRTELAFAVFSGVLLPCFWVSYLVNEMQEFLSFAAAEVRAVDGHYARGKEHASLDGVRALSPVVCTLNVLALAWGVYTIAVFPAPLALTGSMYFGVVWCGMTVFTLLVLTLMLIWSLSEDRETARARDLEIIWGYGQHGYVHLFNPPSFCDKFKELMCCIKTYTMSWTGQTCISGLNHFAAVALFSYGLHHFGNDMSLALKKFLYSGISMTLFGMMTSFASFVMRRYPQYKMLPTDDSFRLACVLKALLVMNKALIVYELSKIDMSANPALRHWTMVITAVCVLSIFILGLLTYAFDALKIYRQPSLVEDVGVVDGKLFVKMYSLSFVCCKLATTFFVLLGHIPDIAGCDSKPIKFHGPNEHDSSIDCTVCYVNNQPPGNAPPDDQCDANSPMTYNRCTTTCTKLFFSGAGEIQISLDVFVLVPLLWLPFTVYSNNEVARMIDGIWQARRDRDVNRGSLMHIATRVGLSSTVHGYSAIVNLSHAVFFICFGLTLYFLAASGGGYFMDVGSICGGTCGSELDALQQPLDKAGRYVTCSIVALNTLMLSRLCYEKLPWLCCKAKATREHEEMFLGSERENVLLGSE
jgi:hypothetical protein